MKKQILSTLTALLLIIAAIVNIRCEAEKLERQAQFQYYLHINSKPYKQSLKMDSIFAQRLDSIDADSNFKVQSYIKIVTIKKER